MSRLYRFFTNPRFFSFFTEKRMNLAEIIPMLFLCCMLSGFFMIYFVSKQDRTREAVLVERVKAAEAEVQHLKAPETKRNGTAQSRPASLKVASETEIQTPAVHAPDDNVDTMSDDTVEVVHTGPLKGLPLDLAMEIHKEYTDASIARAKRYHEWDLRRKDYKERNMAFRKKELAHGEAMLADSKKRREHLLASFAGMSPEQIEDARKKVLKTQPAEDVDLFFKHVADLGTAKSPEQIEQEAQALAENKEVLERASQKLKVEREQLNREAEELQRTKPLPPNLGLDEFYTEWKKRNRTKPSP